MGFRARLRRIWSRPPVRIGAIGGILASLAGIFGYVVVPVLTGAQPSLTEASVAAATTPERFSVLYHAAVSALPPFALAFGGTLVARYWGFSGRRVDATVVGGIVIGPLITVFGSYFVTAIAFGIGFGTRGRDAFESIVGGIGFTVWALVFGILFLVIAFPAVAIVHGTAATIGYLCARGLWHLVRRSEDESESRTVDGDADAGRN